MKTSWQEAWFDILGVTTMNHWWLVIIVLCFLFLFVVIPSALFIAFIERKVGADLQARIGPNRTGPYGFMQSVADVVKLLQKKSAREANFLEEFWLVVMTMIWFSSLVLVPGLGSGILDGAGYG